MFTDLFKGVCPGGKKLYRLMSGEKELIPYL